MNPNTPPKLITESEQPRRLAGSAVNQRGFTLIELLVVIAIIGTLAAIVMASLNVARENARDARRVSDAKQLENASHLYFSENGQWPNHSEPYMDTVNPTFTARMEPFLPGTVTDPRHADGGYFYYIASPDVSWINSNSWAYMTTDCADKTVLVIRRLETDGDYRQDCAMTSPTAISIVLE